MKISDMKINVLSYILKAIPQKLRYDTIKMSFLKSGVTIGFDVKDEELMDELQKIADSGECTLDGDSVYVEIYGRQMLKKIEFTLSGNYLDDLNPDGEGNITFYVNKEGYVYDVELYN